MDALISNSDIVLSAQARKDVSYAGLTQAIAFVYIRTKCVKTRETKPAWDIVISDECCPSNASFWNYRVTRRISLREGP